MQIGSKLRTGAPFAGLAALVLLSLGLEVGVPRAQSPTGRGRTEATGRLDAPGRHGSPGRRGLAHVESVEMGRRVFQEATFNGNGRTCATCHQPQAAFTVTPEIIEATFQEDPGHPLFRPLDSDDGDGDTYFRLRESALFVVPLQLHPDVRVAGRPAMRVIRVRRAVPSIINTALTGPYQLDGRKPDLGRQALGAVFDHMEPRKKPRFAELESLARFQDQVIAPPRLRALLAEDPPENPFFALPVSSNTARRGELDFSFLCSACHSGPMLNVPPVTGSARFVTVKVSEFNRPQLPESHLIFTLPDGSEREVFTPDPGRAALTGDFNDLNAFEIRSLRGIKHTAPYFHDNSAATLEDAVQHYNQALGFDIKGQRLQDLLAFLETL